MGTFFCSNFNNFDFEGFVIELKGILRQFGNDFTVVCVGTDRCVGDALGPLLGTKLKRLSGIPQVIGTLEEPYHALSMGYLSKGIKHRKVLAIDACITHNKKNVGDIRLSDTPIQPGSAMGKKLNPIGDFSLKVCVTDDSFHLYDVRLYTIMNFVHLLEEAFIKALSELREECK